MEKKVSLKSIYVPSGDVVAREVQGEFIIIPVASGITEEEDEIFSLNETGKAVWERLDGGKTLQDVISGLCVEFEAAPEEIKEDVLGLSKELLKRRMLVEKDRS
ncbi:PqqD family protein [bacterium]|nr:MAG: PqqD family protein [bacterium]